MELCSIFGLVSPKFSGHPTFPLENQDFSKTLLFQVGIYLFEDLLTVGGHNMVSQYYAYLRIFQSEIGKCRWVYLDCKIVFSIEKIFHSKWKYLKYRSPYIYFYYTVLFNIFQNT